MKLRINIKTSKNQGGKISLNNTTKNRKSGCGYACAAKGVDHERYVVVLKTRCVIDAKICMSQKKDHENCNRIGGKTCISS